MAKALIIQLARFGDVIQTKRLVLSCLDRGYETWLLVDKTLGPLARLVYPGAEIVEITSHRTGPVPKMAASILTENKNVFNKLKLVDFKRVYNLNYSGMNFAAAALFPPEIVRGYRYDKGQVIKNPWAKMGFRWAKNRHASINLVDFWAGFTAKMIAPETVNPKAKPKGGGVGVVLAGRHARRSLPVSLLSEIAKVCQAKNKKHRLVLLGGKSEHQAGRELMKNLPRAMADKAENLAGKTDWAALYDTVSALDMLITPDTGTMHLAAHLGVPVKAFFLSSAYCFETGPYGEGHTIWQADADCVPCLESQDCPYDVKCLEPFKKPEFLRAMVTEKPEHVPAGILGLKSGFDCLGVRYDCFAGQDRWLEARQNLREFLIKHNALSGRDIAPHRALAETMYMEQDFFCPDANGTDLPARGKRK